MEKLINHLKEELNRIRSDRATPVLVENLPVEAYGQKMSIKELASISIPDPRQIAIQPWDKEIITQIEKALEKFNPKNEGNLVRVFLPALTDERKEELKKEIGAKAEQARIAVRQERDKEREIIKQEKDEDERFRKLKDLDEKSEKINKQIEEIKNNKIKEVCS